MKSCRPALGTYVVIRVEHPDPNHARSAIDQAFNAIALVQQLMSAHTLESELSQINEQAHVSPIRVHDWTYEVLKLAQAVHTASNGLFDCCVGQHLRRWEMLPDFGHPDSALGNMSDLCLHADGHVSARKPVHLDLSGIAKGYAVDRAAAALQADGITDALINAGGDLRVLGEVEEPIYVRHAQNPQQLRLAGHLQNGAFATSGSYFSAKRFEHGETVSALINPTTQRPLISDQSFSVIAPTCAIADALTKVLAIGQNPDHPCFTAFEAQALVH